MAAGGNGKNSMTRWTEEAEAVLRDPTRSHRDIACLACGKWKAESHTYYSKGHSGRMEMWNDGTAEDKMEWTMDFYTKKAAVDQNMRELGDLFGQDPEALQCFSAEVNKLGTAPAPAANAGQIVLWTGVPPPPPGLPPAGSAPPPPPREPPPNNGAGQADATCARRWQQSRRTLASSDGSITSSWQVVPARAPTADLPDQVQVLLDRIAALEARVDALEAPPPGRAFQ